MAIGVKETQNYFVRVWSMPMKHSVVKATLTAETGNFVQTWNVRRETEDDLDAGTENAYCIKTRFWALSVQDALDEWHCSKSTVGFRIALWKHD